MNNEGYTEKHVQSLMSDIKVSKEQIKRLKGQLEHAERNNKGTHENMIKLEQTIKELKNTAHEQKKL